MKKIALTFLAAAVAQIGVPRLEAALTPKDLKPFEGYYRGVMEMSENGRKSTFPVKASLFRYAGGLTQFSVPATTNLKTAVYFDLRRNGSFKSFSLLPGFEYKVMAKATRESARACCASRCRQVLVPPAPGNSSFTVLRTIPSPPGSLRTGGN